jgi:hypothetical protein
MDGQKFAFTIIPLSLGIIGVAWAYRIQTEAETKGTQKSVFGPVDVKIIGFTWFDVATLAMMGIVLMCVGIRTWKS